MGKRLALQSGENTRTTEREKTRTTEWEKTRTTEWEKIRTTEWEKTRTTEWEKDSHYRVGKRLALQCGEKTRTTAWGKQTYMRKAPVALAVSFLGTINMLRVMVPASVPESSPSDGKFFIGK